MSWDLALLRLTHTQASHGITANTGNLDVSQVVSLIGFLVFALEILTSIPKILMHQS
jgi:hypothetical protein